MPEPIITQDGTTKNDGERNAAKRFIAKLRQDHPHLNLIVTEDRLSANAPHIETLHDHDMHDILGVKEGDHTFVFTQVAAAEQAGRVTYYARDDPEKGMHHRFRFLSGMPLNESHADLRVNFIECGETVKGKVQHCRWVTDLRVNTGTVYRLMQGARARWRIEHETFNTLKNQGYHFAHNFGHGYQHLSVVFAPLMMLAFLVDQVQQRCCPLFQAAWARWGSKRLLWEKMRALFFDYALESMRQLFEALFFGLKKSAPIFVNDSSSSASRLRECLPSCAIAMAELRPSGGINLLDAESGIDSDRTGGVKSDKWVVKWPMRGFRHRSYRTYRP